MVDYEIPKLFDVSGLVAVITGGGSGIGLSAARALDAGGARAVYIIGRREKSLQDAAKTGVNGSIKPLTGDVSDKESLLRIVKQIREEQGFINFLFINHGVPGPDDAYKLREKAPDGNLTVKEYQEIMFAPEMQAYTNALHVNCTAIFYTSIAFLDLLDAGNKRQNVPQESQVLVTTSIAGFSRSLNSSFAYSTSKAAANHLVKMMAGNFAQYGLHIRCNLVAPGLYPTEMTAHWTAQLNQFDGSNSHKGVFAGAHGMPADRCPSERTGSEQDIAGLILFMASQAGAYLNGNAMVTDGGRLGQLPATY